MFNGISKEIIIYSVIPVVVSAIIIVLLLVIGKKKNDNYLKYNYFIKVLLAILITFILSLMIGYTIWAYERIINLEIIEKSILYMILLAVIVLSLFLSLVIILIKLHHDYSK